MLLLYIVALGPIIVWNSNYLDRPEVAEHLYQSVNGLVSGNQ